MGNKREPGSHAGRPFGARRLGAVLAAGAVWVCLAMGCKKDCGAAMRLGDFEYSQGNYENAVKRYEQALRDDPGCYNVEGKLAEARRRATGK